MADDGGALQAILLKDYINKGKVTPAFSAKGWIIFCLAQRIRQENNDVKQVPLVGFVDIKHFHRRPKLGVPLMLVPEQWIEKMVIMHKSNANCVKVFGLPPGTVFEGPVQRVDNLYDEDGPFALDIRKGVTRLFYGADNLAPVEDLEVKLLGNKVIGAFRMVWVMLENSQLFNGTDYSEDQVEDIMESFNGARLLTSVREARKAVNEVIQLLIDRKRPPHSLPAFDPSILDYSLREALFLEKGPATAAKILDDPADPLKQQREKQNKKWNAGEKAVRTLYFEAKREILKEVKTQEKDGKKQKTLAQELLAKKLEELNSPVKSGGYVVDLKGIPSKKK